MPAHAVNSANSAIQNHLKQGDFTKNGRKRKYTATFTSEERAKVGKYAAEKVSKHLQEADDTGNQIVSVDMRGGVLKEFGAKWLVGFYDHMQANPDIVIVITGYKEVGIIEAIVKGDDGSLISPPDTQINHFEEDPFMDLIIIFIVIHCTCN